MKKLTLLVIPLIALILFSISVHLAYGQGQPNIEWVSRYDGPEKNYDGASDIAIDRSGNVYVIGHSHGDGTDHDYATIKYRRAH